jgi:hypothetical protein
MAMEYVSSSPTIMVKGAQIPQTDLFNSNQNRLASHPAGLFVGAKVKRILQRLFALQGGGA